jgi:hypothetical protein
MLIKNSDQNVSYTDGRVQIFPPCDFCGERKDNSKGYAHVARGATGRWCEVMHSCNECAGDGTNVIDVEAARIKCSEQPNEWADF